MSSEKCHQTQKSRIFFSRVPFCSFVCADSKFRNPLPVRPSKHLFCFESLRALYGLGGNRESKTISFPYTLCLVSPFSRAKTRTTITRTHTFPRTPSTTDQLKTHKHKSSTLQYANCCLVWTLSSLDTLITRKLSLHSK